MVVYRCTQNIVQTVAKDCRGLKKRIEMLKKGDRVTTDFYKNQKDEIRIVKEVYRPEHLKCQSGLMVVTECGLHCCSNWFKKVEK